MTEKLRKEHEKFEKEIDAGDHGTNSLARSQLAGRVYNDLQDSDWAKKLFEKSLAEVKEENADDENYYYDNLSGIANEIYNCFDKDWAEKIFTEIFFKMNCRYNRHQICITASFSKSINCSLYLSYSSRYCR